MLDYLFAAIAAVVSVVLAQRTNAWIAFLLAVAWIAFLGYFEPRWTECAQARKAERQRAAFVCRLVDEHELLLCAEVEDVLLPADAVLTLRRLAQQQDATAQAPRPPLDRR